MSGKAAVSAKDSGSDAWGAARKLHREGDLAAAVRLYRRVLDVSPAHVQARFNLGIAFMQSGRIEDAAACLEQVVSEAQGFAEAHNALGSALWALGRREQGLAAFERAVALKSGYADALNNLGSALCTLKRVREAVPRFEEAVRVKPEFVDARLNLASALKILKQPEAALAHYEKAAECRPDHAEAHAQAGALCMALKAFGRSVGHYQRAAALRPESADWRFYLANALGASGRYEEAAEQYKAAIALRSAFAAAHNNLANTLRALKRPEDAIAHYRRAVEVNPEFADAHNNLGNLLNNLERHAEAVAAYEKAVALRPNYPTAHCALGRALGSMGRYAHAIGYYRRAIAQRPNLAEAHEGLGIALKATGQPAEALEHYRLALASKPKLASAHNNMGNALYALNRMDEAAQCFDRALALKSRYPLASFNKALVHLALGEFKPGWRLYENRWPARVGNGLPDLGLPLWLGEAGVEGRRIYIQFEQGMGDAIQMLRYVPILERAGAKCAVQLPGTLEALAKRSFPRAHIVARNGERVEASCRVPFMSLPLAMRTFSAAEIPQDCPYLVADEGRADHWKRKFAHSRSRKVGLVWRGNPKHPNDRNRSLPLRQLSPLLDVPGVDFKIMQKDVTPSELEALRGRRNVQVLDADLVSLDETAAVMMNLDIVISVDTAPAHLAAALGRPTWILLAFNPDWRWMLNRDDSPWYPTMRLFRQPALDDWGSVVRDLADSLRRHPNPRALPAPRQSAENNARAAGVRSVEAPGAQLDRAIKLHQTGKLAAASKAYETVLRTAPNRPDVLQLLALTLLQRGDAEESVRIMRHAIDLAPERAESHRFLGNVHAILKRHEEAISSYRKAIKLKADNPEAHHDLARSLKALKRGDEAITHLSIAVDQRADFAEARDWLGQTLLECGRYEEALTRFEKIAIENPKDARAHFHLGIVLTRVNRHREALREYEKALELHPGAEGALWSKALCHLCLGEFAEGWPLYEYGHRARARKSLAVGQQLPLWLGETDIRGKNLLVQSEQGFGDVIQMLRYIPLIARMGAKTWFQAPKPLEALVRRSLSDAHVIPLRSCPDGIDLRIPIMSLPLAAKSLSEAEIPRDCPYLVPDRAKVELWRSRLASAHGRRVGLVWRGNPKHKNDHHRSAKLDVLLPLLENRDIRYVTLQKGLSEAEVSILARHPNVVALDKELTTFDDTAAVIAALDLVISVDTAPAHLSGALGKPIWVLLPFNPEWRWMLDRADSPWYPTARIFRQSEVGNWDGVIASLQAALSAAKKP